MNISCLLNKFLPSSKEVFLPLLASLILCFCLIPFIKLPIFYADYWFSKWVVVYAATIIFAICVFIEGKVIFLPRFYRTVLIGLGGLFSIAIFNHIYYKVSFLTPVFWDRLGFFLLSLSFFNFFRENPTFIRNLLIAIFTANALFILSCIPAFYEFVIRGLDDQCILQQSFGNINMSAEFVGISLILLISGRGYFKHSGWLIDILIYLSIIYCYYASSRSIAVAMGGSLIVLVSLKIVSLKKALGYIIISGIVLSSFEFSISYFSNSSPHVNAIKPLSHVNFIKPSSHDNFIKPLSYVNETKPSSHVNFIKTSSNVDFIKTSSTLARWQIIIGTLEMIKDHPFGVGPGNYLFSFIPYMHKAMPGLHEGYLAQSPHNEYLRIIAEEGIPFALVLLITFSIYLYGTREKFKSVVSNHPTIIGFFSFLAIQAAFQFPLINAFPFIVTACFVGYTLSVFHTDQVVSFSRKGWLLSTSFICLLFLNGIISEAIPFLYPSSSNLHKVAYQMNRDHWQAAMQAVRIYIREGDFISAQQIVDHELEIHPNNYIALSLKAQLERHNGNTHNSCLLLKKIDGFFNGKSIFHTYILQKCSPL